MNHQDICNIITAALPHGVLLNTQHTKFNSMVIGWGHAGIIWGLPTFVIYVRQSRYTKPALDVREALGTCACCGKQAKLVIDLKIGGRLKMLGKWHS